MTIAFISDLHLEPVENDKTLGFFNFLDSAQNKYQQLYILGDFFEYWIGDDDNEPVNLSIQQKLKVATDSGLDIFFVHGNRDFLIGSKFEKNTGVKIIEDMTLIEIGNKSVMVAHGDSFCTDDVEYQEMKKEIDQTHGKIPSLLNQLMKELLLLIICVQKVLKEVAINLRTSWMLIATMFLKLSVIIISITLSMATHIGLKFTRLVTH